MHEQRWFKLANNFDELVETVANLKIRLLAIEQDDRSLVPAFRFGEVGPAYQRLRRVHYHNDEPYCLIDIYLDKDIFDASPEAFRSAPIVSQLAARTDVRVAQARQIVRITVSDEDTASHLNIGVGDPIADVCRTFFNEDGQYLCAVEKQVWDVLARAGFLESLGGDRVFGTDGEAISTLKAKTTD